MPNNGDCLFSYYQVTVVFHIKLIHNFFQVVSHNISPEWKEGFTWAFDVPPKGQKLHIICKSKNTFGKVISGPTNVFSTFFTNLIDVLNAVVAIINSSLFVV